MANETKPFDDTAAEQKRMADEREAKQEAERARLERESAAEIERNRKPDQIPLGSDSTSVLASQPHIGDPPGDPKGLPTGDSLVNPPPAALQRKPYEVDPERLENHGQTNQPELDADNPAVERLRAFEDEKFGEDVMRIEGRIERGSGSPYALMREEDRRHYEALEKLIAAELKLADARTLASQAEADHQEALDACERADDRDADASK